MRAAHDFNYVSYTKYFELDAINKKLNNLVKKKKMAHVFGANVQSHYSSHEQYI